MIRSTAIVPVPNAILFVRDPALGPYPEPNTPGEVWATPNCIAIGTLPDSEGDTSIAIGSCDQVRRDTHLLYDGLLMTPSRRVVVEIVPGETVLSALVAHTETRVQVWTGGGPASDRVTIGLD